jgi:chromosome segregation ATPase
MTKNKNKKTVPCSSAQSAPTHANPSQLNPMCSQQKLSGICDLSITILSEREELLRQNQLLRNENNDLRHKLELSDALLKQSIQISKDREKNDHDTIELLKRENENLIKENQILKEKIDMLEKHVGKLQEENKQIKEENKQIKEENVTLKVRINTLENQVECLQSDNKKLVNQVECLQNDNKKLVNQVECLQSDNKKLVNQVECLQTDNRKLVNKLYNMDCNKLMDAITFAIQDINGMYDLETKINKDHIQGLIDLRQDRNDTAHYLRKNDDAELANYKIIRLYELLCNQKVKNIINDINVDYGTGFIDAIKLLLKDMIKPIHVEQSPRIKKQIDRFLMINIDM